MLDIDDFYANTYKGKYNAPPFEEVLKRCNEWLTSHNYSQVTASDVKDKIKNHSGEFFAYPYGRIYHIIEQLIQFNKEDLEEMFRVYINNIDYTPIDHGTKAGEEYVGNRLSKLSSIKDAPNDYGATQRQIKELYK